MLTAHILEAFLNGDFSSLWPPLAALFTGAYKGLQGIFNGLKDQLNPLKDLQKWAKDYYDDIAPSQMERIRKDVQELFDEVQKWKDDVVKDITNTVNQGLNQGTIDPQTDGGLGQTRDIFTPDGKVPMDVGTMPGMSSDGAGTDRSGGGSSSGGSSGSGYPSSGSSSGSSQPAGSGSSGGSGSTTGSGTQTPTPGDVGAGPGDFVEYQPGANQVVITHPDGTQTIKPWPS